MKVPKRINDFLVKKQDFIDSKRNTLERYVIKMQGNLLDDLFSGIYVDLDVKDGKILDTTHNYQMLREVEKLYSNFNKAFAAGIGSQVIGTTNALLTMGEGYFSMLLTDNLPSRFEKIVKATADKMNLRIGVKGDNITGGGFLDSLLKDNTVATDVKNYMAKSITGQIDTKDFVTGLKDLMKGVPKTIIKDGKEVTIHAGALEVQYKRYAYDLYQQFDAAYNSTLASEFEMQYFIYQGGLVDESRDFCAAHNNKVWSREEAADWVNWTPGISINDYPPGYIVKQKDLSKHPGYMDYPGYSPLVDRGGYNCRHMLGFISDDLAVSLRQDLKSS